MTLNTIQINIYFESLYKWWFINVMIDKSNDW